MSVLGPIDDCRFYRERELSILPCVYAGKTPKLPWKEFQGRLPTVEEIESWCRERINVAIVTGAVSKIVAIDPDSEAAARYVAKKFGGSPMRTKATRGEHLYYKHPGVMIPNKAKLKGIELDVRGDGGYVLAAPSVHPSGAIYERLGDWDNIDKLPVFDPSWIGEERQERQQDRQHGRQDPLRVARAYMMKCPPAISGQNGHGTTLATAIKLVRNFDLSFDDLMTVLMAYNERCEPKWLRKELEHKAAEAIRIVKSPVSIVQQTRREVMSVTLKNCREDVCILCGKEKKIGADVEDENGGKMFLCQKHAWESLKAQSGIKKSKGKKKEEK